MKNIFISIILWSLFSCNSKTEDTRKEQAGAEENTLTFSEVQIKNAQLGYGKLEQRQISEILRVNGTIDVPPQNMVSISVPLGGYLKSSQLLPGMHVNKGQVIAIVEDPQYIQLQEDYLVTKSKLHYSQLEYERQKDLNESKSSSDKVLQQAAAEQATLKIMLKALSEKIQLIGKNPAALSDGNISRSINIYSPINGFVSRVNVNIGKYIAPTDVMFELVDPTDIHLALTVFEKDLPKLFIGQKLSAFTNNQPEKKYPCEILLIGKHLGSERSTEVHCHFETYDKALIPGTYMNAEVEVKSANSYTLPQEAIVRFENKHYVFLKKSANQFVMTEVLPGQTAGGFTEITQPASLMSETLVTKGAYTLLMSLKNKSED